MFLIPQLLEEGTVSECWWCGVVWVVGARVWPGREVQPPTVALRFRSDKFDLLQIITSQADVVALFGFPVL